MCREEMGQPTAVSLPGESPWTEEPGWYSPWGRKELDMTERLSTAQDTEWGWINIPLSIPRTQSLHDMTTVSEER